jgi:hypothetical protein
MAFKDDNKRKYADSIEKEAEVEALPKRQTTIMATTMTAMTPPRQPMNIRWSWRRRK